MPLALPGTSSSILLSQAAAAPATTGTGKDNLNPHLLALLTQGKIKEEIIVKIGEAEVESAAIFGKLGGDEKGFTAWCVSALNMEPARDAIPIARLILIWEA